MEMMDVTRDPAVKMRGEDLSHAYDAVRVANKSVVCQLASPFKFMLSFILSRAGGLCELCGHVSACLCQVSGEPVA